MSEQDETPAGIRRSDAIAGWARVEAKVDGLTQLVTARQESTDRRLAEHDTAILRITENLSTVQQGLAAQQAAATVAASAAAADRTPRANGWTVAAVVLAGLATVTSVILALALKQ